MRPAKYHPGDWVIYRKTKYSEQPGRRARSINPSAHGEKYSYTVDKFWVVIDVQNDCQLVVTTHKGKRHVITADDPLLRHARWWERLIYRKRFLDVIAGTKE